MRLKTQRAIAAILVCSLLAGCSTAGGMYKKDEPVNGEFSIGRTALGVLGGIAIIAGAAAAARGGGGAAAHSYAWDYQPGNGQWVCRDRANGQYSYEANCANQVK